MVAGAIFVMRLIMAWRLSSWRIRAQEQLDDVPGMRHAFVGPRQRAEPDKDTHVPQALEQAEKVLGGPRGVRHVQRAALVRCRQECFHFQQRVARVFGWVESGALKLHVGAEYPLAEAGRAQAEVEARRTTGKIVLTVAS